MSQTKAKKLWKAEDMVRALEEVAAGMPVRHACWVFNVPRNTLRDSVSGRVTHGCRSGPKQRLSPEELSKSKSYIAFVAGQRKKMRTAGGDRHPWH